MGGLLGKKMVKKVVKQEKTNDIQIPTKFFDPITNKIMCQPTMVLSSMVIYDNTTINKWIESKRGFDPMTGIPMSIGRWPLLLQTRNDIKRKIEDFIQKYPIHKSQMLDANDESIQWEALFALHETKIKDKVDKIAKEQSELKTTSKQIFKRQKEEKNDLNDDIIGVKYDDSIIFQSDIPVICIMGPSRCGKSTIVNDILGVKDVCKVSDKSNVALTKGAWIAKYSNTVTNESNSNYVFQVQDTQTGEIEEEKEGTNMTKTEFYLLDMEGLSHNVTTFTKQLFYACYATANVVICNDKEVASDRFVNFMQSLKHEMKSVAKSDTKPSFLYLKRDAG
eukprot:519301_1